ncbi:MAG: sialidase family protein [Polyangiaceae bacterium]
MDASQGSTVLPLACVGPGGCSGFQVPGASGYGVCQCAGTIGDAGGDGTVDAPADAAADRDAPPSEWGPVSLSSSPATSFESETQLAVAPDGTIAVAWIGIGTRAPGSWISYRFSSDGGATFSPIRDVTLPGGLAGSDPALAVDASGNFYLAMVGEHLARATVDYTQIFVAAAPAGTTTFGTPVEVTSSTQTLTNDHPKIHVTAAGTIVVAYGEFPSPTSTTSVGRAATSLDGGSWQIRTIAGAPYAVGANFFWLCEGTGILYTTYLEETATESHVALRSSSDDGATWSAASTVVSLATEIPASLDPGCVASGDDVWVMYATSTAPTMDQTLLGSAQTMPVVHVGSRGTVPDQAAYDALDKAAGALGLLPVLVGDTSGNLVVAYLSGNGEGDTGGSLRYTQSSTDAGFAPSVRVDGPLVFTLNRTTSNWLGDYLGAVVSGRRLLLAYPMNASGTTDIYFHSELLP